MTSPSPQRIAFQQAFLDDDFAQSCERTARGRTSSSFLYTGKRPRLGQRVETAVHLTDTRRYADRSHDGRPQDEESPYGPSPPCRLSGVVTAVGSLPTFAEWAVNQSFTRRFPKCDQCGLSPLPIVGTPEDEPLFPGTCPKPDCLTNRISPTRDARGDQRGRPYTLAALMERCLHVYGTVHSQEIVSYSVLHPAFASMQDRLPFRSGRIYRVRYAADDEMVRTWCVTSIEDVGDAEEPPGDLPKEFLR